MAEELKEQDVVQGGPLDPRSPESQPPEGHFVGGDQTQEAPEKKPIFEGLTQKFNTIDELAEYTKNLETQMAANRLQRDREEATRQGEPISNLYQEKGPEVTKEETDELFNNPSAFVTNLRKSILNDIDAKKAKEDRLASFWESFYLDNPDLRNKKRIVNLIMSDRWAELQTAPLLKAKEILAKESFRFIREMGGTVEGRKEIPETESAIGLSSTRGTAPKVETKATTTTFFGELKAMRDKKMNRAS